MKKIFTLLFCVVDMGFAANASELPLVDKCINVLLGVEQPTAIMAANLDANGDGVINIADVTTLIDMALLAQQQQAPAQQQTGEIDVQAIINDMLDDEPPTPVITDVTDGIDHNIKLKK